MQYPGMMQPTIARIEQVAPEDEEALAEGNSGKFPAVSLRMARNFLVMDTYCESAPSNKASTASSKESPADFLATFNGLGAVSSEIKDLLPPECRKAFNGALGADREFQSRWGTESEKMSRREPIIDKAIVPYSMS